jgi:hypothetical protein
MGAQLTTAKDLELTDPLRKLRILKIWQEDKFVFFMYRPRWIDDAVEVLVFDPTKRSNGVSNLMALYPRRVTYHIQHIHDGWYYWMYN